MTLGPIAFAAPWALLGLTVLPLIWWLLRVTPPAPKRVRFPAIRLLLGLKAESETPAHTPLWLLLLRLTIAALIIIALANPLWRPADRISGSGPLLIILDNGWTSASDWSRRTALMESLLLQARENNRPVALATTAPEHTMSSLIYETADKAASRAAAFEPHPLLPDHTSLLTRLQALDRLPDQVVWISDGLDHGSAADLSEYLYAQGVRIDLIEPKDSEQGLVLLSPQAGRNDLLVPVLRPNTAVPPEGVLTAHAADGRPLGRTTFTFAPDALQTIAEFQLPLELRNEIALIRLDQKATAGNTILLDERWRRRSLGLISSEESAQLLLSDLYYLERALEPFVDIRKPSGDDSEESPIANLLSRPLSLLLLADLGRLNDDDADLVRTWVSEGGVLVRFAGPRLAASADDLIPVPLREGNRDLGGALSWTKPQKLAPFGKESPFFGIEIPDDVTVKRQVLADPRGDLSGHTWARLEDGTPLITARADGNGWIVLIHVTANTEWSNLALSGLYVDILRRLVDLSQGRITIDAENNGAANLAPRELLTAYGVLITPPAWTTPIEREKISVARPNAQHPPGFYGRAGAARALNSTNGLNALTMLPPLDNLNSRASFTAGIETGLKAPLLTLAFILMLLDGLAALSLSGRMASLGRTEKGLGEHLEKMRSGLSKVRSVIILFLPLTAAAITIALPTQEVYADPLLDEKFALAATLETHLAYVVTGDSRVDEESRAGLAGLTEILRRRTALEPGVPIGVNVEKDELAFFPFLYWPVGENQSQPSTSALARIDAYMKQGGTILFDTRDQNHAISGITTASGKALKDILSRLDIPPLEPVPAEHVLTRSFYLLVDFPGRWEGGPLWVEQSRDPDSRSTNRNDGVSAILIGASDYVGAWARDASGRPLNAVVPGGETQREMAARFGVNLVMYALTGNYKADQVHLPALLERLGQ